MKFETTPAFDADYRRLKPEHQAAFRDVVRDRFIPACDAFASMPAFRRKVITSVVCLSIGEL